ncbi:MAG: AAA family ATPase [Thiotrichaceae bacterium]
MLANYRKEREAFEQLLQGEAYRVLLLCGGSGMGKTTLLRTFERIAHEKPVYYVTPDFKDTIVLEDIFYLIGDFLEWENLPNLTGCISALHQPETLNVNVSSNWLIGIKQHLHVVLKTESAKERQERWQQLTDSLSKDLKKLSKPLLILFDTYERADSEIQEWITKSLLARIRLFPQVRIVIAGQQVPEENSVGYGNHTQLLKLEGVRGSKIGWNIQESKQRKAGNLDETEFLQPICDSFHGHPQLIARLIEGLSTTGECA